MAADAESSAGLATIPAFEVPEDDEQAPEVLAQIVDDMDQSADEEEEGEDDETNMQLSPTGVSGTFIPPQPPIVPDIGNVGGFHVRLTLSVGAGGASIAPGLEIDDCGMCPFCLDKPKYGGPGTKRQKCELKQQEASFTADNREPRIWAKLHLVTGQEMEQIKQISKLPLPEPLVSAIETGPLPLVWAYRRKRRARTLPPAYVLMYYCEERVPLDRSQLAVSRQRYFKNSRTDLATGTDKGRMRKPRVSRPRIPTVTAYPGDEEDPNMAPLAMAASQMADPNVINWQAAPPGGVCPVVYGQPVTGSQASMYAQPPSYMVSSVPPPGAPMYSQAYASMYPPPQHMYAQPPMAMSPEEAPQPGRRGRKRGPADDGMGVAAPGMPAPSYYAPPPDQYYAHAQQPPPMAAGMPMEMGHMGQAEEDMTNSWLSDPTGGEAGDYGRAPKRTKRGAAPRAAPASGSQAEASGGGGEEDGNAMSNKTLELMLSKLQGQLPPATYEKVITLVRDVQCRRMSLSRSEFLNHFQAICAGNPKPR